jgi:heme/copper-type cytochrome/quinol oxidase subunit 2
MGHAHGTVAFFQAIAPVLIANVLAVTFVYCFAKVHQKELAQEEEGRLTYLWLIVLIFLFMLYGLYTWGV